MVFYSELSLCLIIKTDSLTSITLTFKRILNQDRSFYIFRFKLILRITTFEGTLKFANVSFLTNGSISDAESSLKRAQRILKKLRNRDFSEVSVLAKRGQASSKKILVTADELKKQAEQIQKRAGEFLNGFSEVIAALENLRQESNRTKQLAQNATAMVILASEVDWMVCVITFHNY